MNEKIRLLSDINENIMEGVRTPPLNLHHERNWVIMLKTSNTASNAAMYGAWNQYMQDGFVPS